MKIQLPFELVLTIKKVPLSPSKKFECDSEPICLACRSSNTPYIYCYLDVHDEEFGYENLISLSLV